MKQGFTHWAFTGTVVLLLVLALVAWTNNPYQHKITTSHSKDTLPSKLRDLDKELRQLDEAKKKLSEQDFEKIEQRVKETLNKIDIEKIQQQADAAMQRLEAEKTQQQIEESLSRLDFDKIQEQIDESMDRLDMIDNEELKQQLKDTQKQVKEALDNGKWKADLEKALSQNKQDMQKQMLKLKNDMARLKEEITIEKFNFSKEMEKANRELADARIELQSYQEMIYEMEKEGLLNTDDDYTIEYSRGELLINDKKQPQDVLEKYKKYFKKDKVTIKKQDGEMHIQHKHFD